MKIHIVAIGAFAILLGVSALATGPVQTSGVMQVAGIDDHHDHSDEGQKSHDDAHASDKHHDHHDEHGGSKFGARKAIVEVEGGGNKFRLSENAIKILGVETKTIVTANDGVYEIFSKSIVEFQDEIAVFRRSGDWFQLVEITIQQRGKSISLVKASQLSAGDEIVMAGVALLRVAHLEASGQGGQGHIH